MTWIRGIEDLDPDEARPETVLGLAEAKVAFADYALLQSDFQGLREGTPGRPALDRWLIENTAFLSEPQAGQTLVNTEIRPAARRKTAFRAPNCGRVLILPVEEPGSGAARVLDAKGIGLAPGRPPGQTPHSNGLLTLGEALREVLMEKLVRAVFLHSGCGFETVPNYGVLALGFDVKVRPGVCSPAGLLLRRVYRRPRRTLYGAGSREAALELEAELCLRRYGITSTGPNVKIEIERKGEGLEVRNSAFTRRLLEKEEEEILAATRYRGGREVFVGANVQLTRSQDADSPRILDFGGFRVKERFEDPLLSLVSGRLLRIGEVLRPEDPGFVQPDPRDRLPFELLGGRQGVFGYSPGDPALANVDEDNSRILTQGLARDFQSNRITPEELRALLGRYVERATAHLGLPAV